MEARTKEIKERKTIIILLCTAVVILSVLLSNDYIMGMVIGL